MDPIDRHALLTRIYEYPPERDGMSAPEWYRKCIYEAPSLYPEVFVKQEIPEDERRCDSK